MAFEEKSTHFKRLTTLYDVSFTVLAYFVSYWLHDIISGSGSPSDFFSHIALLPLIIAMWNPLLGAFGAYRSPRVTSRFDYGWAVLRAVTIGLVVLVVLLFILKIQYVSRIIVVTFAVLDFAALVGIRFWAVWYFRKSLSKGENFLKVLIIGTGNRAIRFASILKQNSEWGLHIVGHLDPDPERVGQVIEGSPVLGSVDDISSILKGHVIDEVVLAVPRAMIPDVDRIAHACEEEGVKLRMMADVFDVHVARMKLVDLGGIPLLTLEQVAHEEWKVLLKRIMDLVISVIAMPVLLPVMGLIALAVRLDSPGPVLFIQQRIGQNKRRFPMYKFRTMVQDAEKLMSQIEHLNEAEGPIFKIANDPRVTKVGRILRTTSLDELPQIFNVIRGEMSLVGPRPMSIRDVDLFDKGIQRKRFSVKPGITCLWQVSGRSELPFTKWLELDLQYIENWSIGLDIKILLKTIPIVLKRTGAV
jgi:exopolysaccharide biosynthesis polyprenyl glycosylphosphotransferase